MTMDEKYYTMELEQLYEKLQTSPKAGLTEEKAEKRLEEFGPNELPKVSKGFIKIYLAPLFNWLIVIYLVGALILFIAGILGADDNFFFIALTLGIVGLNCVVAIVQQYRATKKLEALREMTAPTTTVIREGIKKEIATGKVVVGDLLDINQGDKIPADSRITNSSNLEINEAPLTGESEPVKKSSKGIKLEGEKPIQDRDNMLFYGTYVATGTGKAIVVKTGKDTEIGKISQGLEAAGTSEIPIRKKMNNFGKWLGLAVIIFWFVTFLLKLITGDADIIKSLNSALDILPLNIPLLTTIVLLTGVLAMANQGVIIRNLASVDSLGRVSVVCSDKTGTMTKNQMSVQHIWSNGSHFKVTGTGYTPEGDIILKDEGKDVEYIRHPEKYPYLELLLISGFLNNNSALVRNEIDSSKKGSEKITTWNVVGSPTEGALNVLFQKALGDYSLQEYEQIAEFPFDSSIKRMTKVFKHEEKFQSFTKGATEFLLPLCSRIALNDTKVEFTDDLKQEILEKANHYASQGYRILSLCYKEFYMMFEDPEENREKFESDLVYLGFVAILDPPREGVKDSVEECKNAGVDVVMITGDSSNTARAIGKQISIIRDDNDQVVEGKDIENIESWFDFNRIKVFARVSPEHKEDIIERYQDEKRVVAMTGDGVNDTLALNMADAGLAMGIQGTDVAKEAADMVISDDSFNSIVKGIHQGRGIFQKIRAVVFFYICINLFEGLIQFFLAVLLGFPYFLDDLFYFQWIFLSITLHTFPGLILTFDTISDDVMKEKPRNSEEILSKNTIVLLAIFGVLLAVSMIITYFIVITGVYPVFPQNYEFGAFNQGYLYTNETIDLWLNTELGYTASQVRIYGKTLTMLMLTLFFCETFLTFQIRRPNKSLLKSFKEDWNKWMLIISGFLFSVFIMLVYIPGVQTTLAEWGINFMFMYLTTLDWLVCLAISMICIVSFEVVKYYARKKNIKF